MYSIIVLFEPFSVKAIRHGLILTLITVLLAVPRVRDVIFVKFTCPPLYQYETQVPECWNVEQNILDRHADEGALLVLM
jgi:hypothetical protein